MSRAGLDRVGAETAGALGMLPPTALGDGGPACPNWSGQQSLRGGEDVSVGQLLEDVMGSGLLMRMRRGLRL